MTIEGVDLALVQRVLKSTLDELEHWDRQVIVDSDYYWYLRLDEVFDYRRDPRHFDLGQISGCFDFMEGVDPLKEDTIPVAHALVWVADVLRAIAYAAEASE